MQIVVIDARATGRGASAVNAGWVCPAEAAPWRHCDSADQRAGMEALLRLAEGTMEHLDDYPADGVEFEMHAQGLLTTFLSTEKRRLSPPLEPFAPERYLRRRRGRPS